MSNIHHVFSLNNTPLTRPALARSSSTVESLLSRKRKRPGVSKDSTSHAKTEGNKHSTTKTQTPKPGQFSFVIKSDSRHNAPPQSFQSLLSIPRSQLPLTFLDTSTTPTRLFSSHLPPLEDAADDGKQDEPRVVIARAESHISGPLFAVERVKSKVYVLCGLASWVKPDHFQALASVSAVKQHAATDEVAEEGQAHSWWQACLASEGKTTALPSLPSRKAPRLSMTRQQPHSHAQEQGYTQAEKQVVAAATPVVASVDDSAALQVLSVPEVEAVPTSAEDVFVRFINQYLETLYLSRTPLSFFAKGPVSRARAAFTSNQIEASTLLDHVSFLRAMIQPSSAADKKYRDKLPETLKKLATAGRDDDASPVKEKKRRKKRRLRPDKYGMHQDEDDFFEKWWHGDEASMRADQTAEQCLKKRSAQLRTRETFMQLILILEVLSLEALPEVVQAKAAALPSAHADSQSQSQTNDSQARPSKSKAKKGDDLTVALELLLDKLGIWHSLDSDILADDAAATDKTKPQSNDLRDFCIEVIIPFYLSRCPAHAADVNKKLGGPSASSSKPKSAMSKPGEPELRQRPDKKARKPLHRVATETAAAGAAKAPPSLRHSNTDSQLLANQIKREASEAPPLSTIPSFRSYRERDSQTPGAASQPPSRRQSGVAGLKAREVDFTALQAAQEAKAKKKKEVEEKLRDAISGLKRPDRLKAGREVMEVAEQRRLIASGRARGAAVAASKKGGAKDTAKDSASAVHVAATPSHGRSQDVIKATPMRISQPVFGRPNPSSPHVVPSSGPIIVPSSSMRPRPTSSRYEGANYDDFEEVEEDTLVPATGRRQRVVRYEITPSKKTATRQLPTFDEEDKDGEEEDVGCAAAQTPSRPSRSFDVYATPSKSFSSAPGDERKFASFSISTPAKVPNVVSSTPVKQPAALVAATPVGQAQVHKQVVETTEQSGAQGKSIYDALGWNDDFSD